jgi:hypothetical protein
MRLCKTGNLADQVVVTRFFTYVKLFCPPQADSIYMLFKERFPLLDETKLRHYYANELRSKKITEKSFNQLINSGYNIDH